MRYIRKKISRFFYWIAGVEALIGVVALFFLQRLGLAQIGTIFLHVLALDKREWISEETAVRITTAITRAMFHDTICFIAVVVFFPLAVTLSILIGRFISPAGAEKRRTKRLARKRTSYSRQATA